MAKPRDLSSAVGIFVGVLLSLQIFLLTVGLDALHAADTHLAWICASFRRPRGRLCDVLPVPPLMSAPEERSGPARPGPIGGDMASVLWGVARRFQLPALQARHSKTWVLGLFAFVNGVVSIAIMAALAVLTRAPFVFPSLGPTAFLLFYTPTAPAASPRNALGGHLIGCLAGYLSLVVFGLTDRGPALALGLTWSNVASAALSLGLTSGAMVWCRVPHPPAGATTLIVSLGILREPWQLGVLMLGVALLVVQGFAINRLAGIDYPGLGAAAESLTALVPGAPAGEKGSSRSVRAMGNLGPIAASGGASHVARPLLQERERAATKRRRREGRIEMANRTRKPMAEVRASMNRMRADGEELVGRLRRDAQALLKSGRAEIARDVQSLTRRADRTLRTVETRVLQQLHAATTDQVKRLERRLAKVEQMIAGLERRLGSAKTAA